ncbi:monocarboxylate transporter 9-like isoform X1 [Biomphalaria glabrata]|nr:monocarboxylate transporter 9-like isoform X1 [Biomphalaria glabrata]
MTKPNCPNYGQPIDTGWSWVICFASFMCYFLIGTSGQALSVLFLELSAKYQSSLTVTSLTIMLQILLLSVSSIVSVSILVPKIGERRITVAAGVVFAGCSVGCSLSPNIVVFIIFCAIQGLSVGAVLVPVIGILGYYFDQRRSLAMSISSSGLCVSTIAAPPLIRALMEAYGLRGTFLFLAGVELNMTVAGMLLRPATSYRTSGSMKKKLLSDIPEKDKTNSPQDMQVRENHSGNHHIPSPSVNSEETNHISEVTHNLITRSHGDGLVQYTSTSKKDGTQDVHQGTKNALKQRPVLTRYNSIIGGVEAAETAIDETLLEKVRKTEDTESCTNCCCLRLLKEIFNPELFEQWAFLLFLLATIPGATNQYLFQYIPTIAVFQGATRSEGATILTVCGCVDLVSRILTGLLADTRVLRPTQIVAISQICLGIVCQFNMFFTDFNSLIIMGVLVGLFVGPRQSLLPPMLLEIVGMAKMSRCLSLTAVVGTISAASHSPALSAVVQSTGSYAIVLYYVGIALISSAIGLLLTPLVTRLQNKKKGEN